MKIPITINSPNTAEHLMIEEDRAIYLEFAMNFTLISIEFSEIGFFSGELIAHCAKYAKNAKELAFCAYCAGLLFGKHYYV